MKISFFPPYNRKTTALFSGIKSKCCAATAKKNKKKIKKKKTFFASPTYTNTNT